MMIGSCSIAKRLLHLTRGRALSLLVLACLAPLARAQKALTGPAFATGSWPVLVATGDFNGDGAPDLLYLDQGAAAVTGRTHVLLNDGRGHFAESASIVTAGSSVAVGDLSGHGHVDVGWVTFSADSAGGRNGNVVLHVAPGDGAGQFGPTVDLMGPAYSVEQPPVFDFLTVARLNRTGPLAVVAEDVANRRLLLWRRTSSSGFELVASGRLESTGPASVADLDGDGLDDVVVEGTAGSVAQVFLTTHATSGGGLGVPGRFTGTDGVGSLLVKDVNGDGKPDLISEDAGGRVEVFAGLGDGTFQYPSIAQGVLDGTENGGRLIAAGDLDVDGRVDVLAVGVNGVVSLLGNGVGRLELKGTYGAGLGRRSLATADFNGDGFLDVAGEVPGGFGILYGNGDGSFRTTAAAVGTLAALPEPAAFEGGYSLIATVGGPDGLVDFSIDGTALGTTAVANGVATLDIAAFLPNAPRGTPPLPGAHALSAIFRASPSAPGTILTGTHVVNLAPTTVTLQLTTPLQVYFGEPIDGRVIITVLDANYLPVGTYSVFSNGAPVTGCVNLPNSTFCPYGNPNLLDAGSYVLTLTYNGDAVNAPGLSPPYPFLVMPDLTTATLTSSSNPANYGSAVTFTAAVMGNVAVPNGTVQFFDGGMPLGSGTLNAGGVATLTTTTLSVGAHTITANYGGNHNFNAATTGALKQEIVAVTNTLPSQVFLTSSLNPAAKGLTVTFTGTVVVAGPLGQIATGVVSFLDGATVIGNGTLNGLGVATFSTSGLTVGAHAITASYGGDAGTGGGTKPPVPPGGPAPKVVSAGTLPSVSAVLTEVITTPLIAEPAGFGLTVTTTPITVGIGRVAVLRVAVTPISGFSQAVQLSCAGLPYEAACGFLQETIPAGGGVTTLDVSVMAPHDCGDGRAYGRASLLGSPVAACLLGGLGLLLARRRKGAWLLALVLGGLAGLSGCGRCTDLGTRPGSYTFTVNAAAVGGPVSESASQAVQMVVTTTP